MLFVLLFEDDPARLDVRRAFMKEHIDYLTRHRDRVVAAGSLREDAESSAVGGMWVVDVADRAEAEALYREDPFWTNGLRRSVRVLAWSVGMARAPFELAHVDTPPVR